MWKSLRAWIEKPTMGSEGDEGTTPCCMKAEHKNSSVGMTLRTASCEARGHAPEFSVKLGIPYGRGKVAVLTRKTLRTAAV